MATLLSLLRVSQSRSIAFYLIYADFLLKFLKNFNGFSRVSRSLIFLYCLRRFRAVLEFSLRYLLDSSCRINLFILALDFNVLRSNYCSTSSSYTTGQLFRKIFEYFSFKPNYLFTNILQRAFLLSYRALHATPTNITKC